ncbi:MAG: hypothetical protein AABX59_00785 [Nanoarchaeota archaeon]
MTQNNEGLERQVIALVAADRIEIPISSLSGKLKRMKPKLAQQIILPSKEKPYNGERVYARIETENEQKARGMKEGIEVFCEKYPQYGTILKGIIEEEREVRETHLYFGMNDGKRLTADDYLTVMADLGFGEASARSLYHELVEVSRNISKKRDEERSIMLGTTL